MSFPVIKCSYRAEDIEIDPHEVLRYLGYKKELVTAEDIAQVQALLPEARAAIKAAACWGRFVQPYGSSKWWWSCRSGAFRGRVLSQYTGRLLFQWAAMMAASHAAATSVADPAADISTSGLGGT